MILPLLLVRNNGVLLRRAAYGNRLARSTSCCCEVGCPAATSVFLQAEMTGLDYDTYEVPICNWEDFGITFPYTYKCRAAWRCTDNEGFDPPQVADAYGWWFDFCLPEEDTTIDYCSKFLDNLRIWTNSYYPFTYSWNNGGWLIDCSSHEGGRTDNEVLLFTTGDLPGGGQAQGNLCSEPDITTYSLRKSPTGGPLICPCDVNG